MGVATFHRLIAEHGSAQASLAALPGIAQDAGLDDYQPCPEGVALAELRAGHKAGARLVCMGDAAYPISLSQISDAPPVIWLKGDVALMQRQMIAVVGARNASSLGTRMARTLAEGLSARGVVVVSGLARGIDTVAHKAALGGGTVAVLAGGLDQIYPADNASLAAEIGDRGVLLTEQPFGLDPQARHFPLRNRIISGLCRALVVIEAAAGSGSLITARAALDQGRDVMAVPGHPFDARASGCNQLIRDGALLVRGAEDVLAACGEAVGTAPAEVPEAREAAEVPPSRPAADIRALHSRILDSLGPSPLAEDQLIRDLGLPSASVTPELVTLELEGRIARQAGGLLARLP